MKGWVILCADVIVGTNQLHYSAIYKEKIYTDHDEAVKTAKELYLADLYDNVYLQDVDLSDLCDGCQYLKNITKITEVLNGTDI